jgi:two-component sensor histidine kinase
MVDTETRIRELEHRFRNILTIVRSLVSQSLQAADSIEDARSTIDERLAALGSATEQLLSHSGRPRPSRRWPRMHWRTSPSTRSLRLDGPTVTIGPKAAMTLTLAFHELATNAIKYGALSNETGTIELTWKVLGSGIEAELWMQWAEHGGPPVVRPERRGFGSRLICTAASRSLRGRAELNFRLGRRVDLARPSGRGRAMIDPDTGHPRR